jgi:hypothetical protein
MYYLVTDSENKTFGNVVWSENVVHEEMNNPNKLFSIYDDPTVAHFMNPAYDGFKNPTIWEAEGEKTVSFGFRHESQKIKTIKKVEMPEPTNDQRIAFAILCSLHLVSNQAFKFWAISYLKSEENRTKESAENVLKQLQQIEFGKERNPQDEYVSCAIPCLMSVILDPVIFTANTAHRAYYDSPEKSRIDMIKLAEIATKLKMEEIAEIL